MLKLIYSPTDAEIEAALEKDRSRPKAEIIAELPRKSKEVSPLRPGFAIMEQGVKYIDPETDMVHVDLFSKLERVELDFDVTEKQKKYALAFRVAYSDATRRGPRLRGAL